MFELIFFGALWWACQKSAGFERFVKVIVFSLSVIGLFIFAREGILETWAIAIISIPVNLFKGVFGILFA